MTGNRISTQTGIGTAIAIAGVAIYSVIKANLEDQKKVWILSILLFPTFAIGSKLMGQVTSFKPVVTFGPD